MGPAQNLPIVKESRVQFHCAVCTSHRLSCREETSFALCNVAASSQTLIKEHKVPFGGCTPSRVIW